MSGVQERVPVPAAAIEGLEVLVRQARVAAAAASLGAICGCIVAALVWSTPLAMAGSVGPACAAIAWLFAVKARRASRLRGQVASGCRPAFVVDWLRPPDGCNFAVFAQGCVDAAKAPSCVVRAGTIASAFEGEALILGGDAAGAPAAVMTKAGEVVAIGRVLGDARARRVWGRRHRPTPWWSLGRRAQVRPDH
jgi:hypothetical protein